MKSRLNILFTAAIIFGAATVVMAQAGGSMQKPAPAATGSYDKALLNPAALNAKAPETFDVKFSTTVGDFTVHVTRAWAPNGADRFYNLVKHHYFDGSAFYRAIAGFMAQWGISGVPEVDRVWENATIKDDPVTHSNKRGMLTFAATGAPNSRGTQLFISFGDNSYLDKDRFAPLGEVTSGMDVVDKINTSYANVDPDAVSKGGTAYIKNKYPNMTIIKTTTLVEAPKP
jgi:peptidyl-prolyl cis-trans isomerase A (cyclophilin A)